MMMIRTFAVITTLLLLLSPIAQADLIKKSKSDICHDTSSSSYNRTKNYTAYADLKGCLQSGGRLPKNKKISTEPASSSGRYDRKAFGHGWDDADHNCMNTRHELLMKQSTNTVDTGSNRCTVSRGRWFDPYTGKTFYDARDLDIDHLVPLKWAWEHNADSWTKEKRERFANDEVNLFAVQASVNREKGAHSPLKWMPPAQSFHCQYVIRFMRVVKTYGLVLSSSEKMAIEKLKEKNCYQ